MEIDFLRYASFIYIILMYSRTACREEPDELYTTFLYYGTLLPRSN
jgi:hypothetical protein